MKKANKSDPSKPGFIKVNWIDGLQVVATDSAGHSIVMDASKQSGGESSEFSAM